MAASPVACAIALACLGGGLAFAGEDYGIGRAARPDEIAGWNIDVAPDGTGLPPGRGGVREGEAIYAEKCAACHGRDGDGNPMVRLAGGAGTIGTARPVKTVGSYWPFATTLYDFIHRAMPLDAPQSLSPSEVYAVSAYVLFLNRLVSDDAVLDAASLPKVVMPNRSAFESAYKPQPHGLKE
jgi:S-disulfanyl-L-cysteine oxidoreductase SoxD